MRASTLDGLVSVLMSVICLRVAGMYKGASFKFTFAIEQDYPHKAPKVKCVPKVGRSQLISNWP